MDQVKEAREKDVRLMTEHGMFEFVPEFGVSCVAGRIGEAGVRSKRVVKEFNTYKRDDVIQNTLSWSVARLLASNVQVYRWLGQLGGLLPRHHPRTDPREIGKGVSAWCGRVGHPVRCFQSRVVVTSLLTLSTCILGLCVRGCIERFGLAGKCELGIGSGLLRWS